MVEGDKELETRGEVVDDVLDCCHLHAVLRCVVQPRVSPPIKRY